MNSLVLGTILALVHGVIKTNAFQISFIPMAVTVHMDENVTVEYTISDLYPKEGKVFEPNLYSENNNIASLENETLFLNALENQNGSFSVKGIFLGRTLISCKNQQTNGTLLSQMEVIVLRNERMVDTCFIVSVSILVSLIYINFGCAMNWGDLRHILEKPIGPTIGFCGQFVFMPLLSYGLGQLLFPNDPAMQLGMFFTGVSPGGGSSNLWTLLLGGNINLSIAMSAVSTFAAFFMMPAWIFTLGRVLFRSGNLAVPYTQIFSYVVALIVPLGVGYLIQRYLKKVAHYLVGIMKMLSICLLLFIIIFATGVNLWLFEIFSWKIVVAGMAVPLLGYLSGFLMSKLLRQPQQDCTAIAIEIGIQNTGIAIFLLRFSLPQPDEDLTAVVPVSISIFAPLPLILVFIFNKMWARFSESRNSSTNDSRSVSTLKI